MKVRLHLPPFDTHEMDVVAGACVVMPIELRDGSMYALTFALAAADPLDPDAREAWLSAIQCDMPPLTPEANPLERGDQARLPMMEGGAFSATLEAAQRRTEWAARGVVY